MKKIFFFISFGYVLVSNAQYKYTKAVKLDTTVNSKSDETSPVLSSDGKTLYFARTFSAQNTGGSYSGQDVWFSEKDASGNWQSAKKANSLIANKFENAPVGISSDGNVLFVTNTYLANNMMGEGLSSLSKSADGTWNNPKTIVLKNFQLKKNTIVTYHVSRNGKHLFISRFAKDSTDLEDIFVCHSDGSGNWSEPINLGNVINTTKGFETSPYLAEDDSTLYFSSNGIANGYGDGDIYMSKRLDDSWINWSAPLNLGSNINTSGFDGYFIPTNDGTAYFVSGDDNSTTGDIYSTKLMRQNSNVNISILDKKTSKPIEQSTVTCFEVGTKKQIASTVVNNGSGSFLISSKPAKYYVVAHSQGHVAIEEELTIANELINKDTSLTMALSPIEVGQKIQLNHVYFETAKANLLESSFTELDILIEVLNENPSMVIQISGHTDNKGKPKANMQLSENRVKSVVEHLKSKGIESSRLKYKGYGSNQPIADNKTEEGRAKNRRVEFQILKN